MPFSILSCIFSVFHTPVLLFEVISHLPTASTACFVDATVGGGGHFFEVLKIRQNWRGEGWDQDPLARDRIESRARADGFFDRIKFFQKNFSSPPEFSHTIECVLADLGVSSFQLDDFSRGMSLHGEVPPDFRMNPSSGASFSEWLASTSQSQLEFIFLEMGEEPRAAKLAREMKSWGHSQMATSKLLADNISKVLGYSSPSRRHPATRAFQALRIAINDELGELKSLLNWAPQKLSVGGRLMIISFHSLEDRMVKNAFRALAANGEFGILTKKPLVAGPTELQENARSRSAKLRVLERIL